MTERKRPQVQVSELRFLQRIEGVTPFNKVRSFEIRKFYASSHYFYKLKGFSLDGLGHVSRLSQERLPKQVLLAKANWRKPIR